MHLRLLLLAAGLSLAAGAFAQDLTVTHLRFEHQGDAVLGTGETAPRFSWQLQTTDRDVLQTAYQIRVAQTPRDLERGRRLTWDSGRTPSDQSVLVPYDGPELGSRERYYWQVRVWDNQGHASAWSEPAYWEMGLLAPTDWTARWIEPAGDPVTDRSTPAPLLRKDFALARDIASARLYVTSHGLYRAEINGQRVGDLLLTPGWTSYDHRLQYQTYDVTELLRRGDNAIGVALGDGWYRGYLGWSDRRNVYGNQLGLLLQLEVRYRNGRTERIVSDGTWRAGTGAILKSDIYNGEHYDARQEVADWSQPGFAAAGWTAVTIADHGMDRLVAPVGPGVRVTEVLEPVEVITTPAGETVLDFGQNLVGRLRFTVDGPAGSTVTVHHAEVLDKEGNFYTDNLRTADQEIRYTLRGGGPETYAPQFTFMGFRYVRVRGWPGELDPAAFRAEVFHSDMSRAGRFTSSDPLLNRLQENIRWGQRGNFVDVPTDCPQRDERLGWTGDAQAFARTATFNYDVAGFFHKWLADLDADQTENGSVPFVIPNVLGTQASGAAGWADAATIIPWTLYQVYGDERILEQQYESMKAWVRYMEETAGENDLWNTGFHFGDWLFYSVNDDRDGRSAITDKYLIAQSFFIHSADLLEQTATVLGKTEDARYYRALAERLRRAYRNEYVTPSGRLVSSTQTAYVLALHFDLLPVELRPQAVERLVDNIRSYGHLTTGFLGTPYLLHVLSRFGHPDLAYQLLHRKEYPSWLYPVTMGATTIWERWDGTKPDSTFQNVGMNSFNHYAYGAVGDWLYRTVAGLDNDPAVPGYRRLRLHPQPGGELDSAQAEYDTPYGPAACGWQQTADGWQIDVTVPPNTTARLVLPGAGEQAVRLDGKDLTTGNGIHSVAKAGEDRVIELGSGSYRFTY
jgi:alpha-L-rhamnosidase